TRLLPAPLPGLRPRRRPLRRLRPPHQTDGPIRPLHLLLQPLPEVGTATSTTSSFLRKQGERRRRRRDLVQWTKSRSERRRPQGLRPPVHAAPGFPLSASLRRE